MNINGAERQIGIGSVKNVVESRERKIQSSALSLFAKGIERTEGCNVVLANGGF
jgi:hypothetical protein